VALPVANKVPLQVDIVSIVSPPPRPKSIADVIWLQYRKNLSEMLNTLSQLKLARGSISITGLDLIHRSTPFRQSNVRTLDRVGLTNAITSKDYDIVRAESAGIQASSFLLDAFNEHLANPSHVSRALIFVSSGTVFEGDRDPGAVTVPKDYDCRAYHLILRETVADAFDDLDPVLKPLHPNTFDVRSPLDFRKALAEITKDLAN
jgi:hypothetical protein